MDHLKLYSTMEVYPHKFVLYQNLSNKTQAISLVLEFVDQLG